MTFLNASLILGVAAVSIPIVMHLIARREPKKVVFPSIRFLTQRFESNRSRMRLRRWWLLALRIAAIAVFALALARPAIDRSVSMTWMTIGLLAFLGVALLVMATIAVSRELSRQAIYGLGGAAAVALLAALLWGGYAYASGPAVSLDEAAPVAIAIVLDNSPTSAWKAPDDDRIGRLRELASWMVARLPAASRIAIIDRSSQPASFALDASGALAAIDQTAPLQVVQPIASRINAAARLLRTSDLKSRQILVITDLASSTWGSIEADSSLASTLQAEPEVALTIFDLGDFSRPNRSLSIPRLADSTPIPGVAVPLSTSIDLSEVEGGDSLSVTAELELYEPSTTLPVVRNGEVAFPRRLSVDRNSVRLAPGGSSQLLMTLPPLEIGTHHGLVRLVGDDALAIDDERYFTLRVLPPVPLLVVADDTNEAQILQLAMSDEFAVESLSYADLPVIRLADYPAIFMVDPPRDVLRDDVLSEFVDGGGALLVCLGPAAGNEAMPNDAFPALVRPWRAPSPGTFFQFRLPSHPLLAPLTELPGGIPWEDFRVHQYWQVSPKPEDTVLMRYIDSGHPALLERTARRGESNESQGAGADRAGEKRGKWLTLTTPLPALASPTSGWNDLYSASEPWPAFLLTRQLAEYLTDRGGSAATTTVGTPQVIPLPQRKRVGDEPDLAAASVPATRRMQLFAPGSSTPVPLEIATQATEVAFRDVSRAGTYWLRGASSPVGFSANLPRSATALKRIDSSEFDKALGIDRYTLVSDREEIVLTDGGSERRVMLHSPLMLLAMIVFLLEQVLGNRFYRGRRSAASTNVGVPAA